ncbi:MAG: hypothetical protein ACRC0G_04360, partial [Fusobacteriaceae bacterium]
APKWVEIASAWKGIMPQSGEESLSIKIKTGMTVTLTSDTKINLYVNKNKNVANPAEAKKPDFRVMVPNDGSVVPVQQAQAKPATNTPYQNNQYGAKPEQNTYQKPATPQYQNNQYGNAPTQNAYQKPATNGYQNNQYGNAPAQNNYATPKQDVVNNQYGGQSSFEDSDLPSY